MKTRPKILFLMAIATMCIACSNSQTDKGNSDRDSPGATPGQEGNSRGTDMDNSMDSTPGNTTR